MRQAKVGGEGAATRPATRHARRASAGAVSRPDLGTPLQAAPPSDAQNTPAATSSASAGAPTPTAASAPAGGPGAVTPATGPSAPVSGAAPAAAPGHPRSRARRAGHAGRRRGRAARVHARRPAGLAPSRALVPVGATRAAHATRHPSRAARRGSPSTPALAPASPLVRTITRIVDVVPAPVRILLGCLLSLALALGARAWLGARDARRLERQRRQLLEDVGVLQAALLPVPPAHLGPLGVSVAYRPAEGPGAGGDFYDVFALEDGRVAVLVGDISGHGRQALPHTALVRFTLRAYLEAGLAPRVAVQTAGAVLERQLGESFATVVAATYDPRERVLTYACAGHPPPVVYAPPGERPGRPEPGWPEREPTRETLAPLASPNRPAPQARVSSLGSGSAPVALLVLPTVGASPPIGVGMRTGTRQTTVSLPGQTVVCFHTDGVTEARVGAELFGEWRLVSALAELGPGASAPELLDRVAEATDARPDDMAACLLDVSAPVRVGGAAAPAGLATGAAPAGPAALVEEIELDATQAASARAQRFLAACGVEREEIPGLLAAAGAAAGQAGTAILEVRLDGARPEVTLRRERVARLHVPTASLRTAAGAAG